MILSGCAEAEAWPLSVPYTEATRVPIARNADSAWSVVILVKKSAEAEAGRCSTAGEDGDWLRRTLRPFIGQQVTLSAGKSGVRANPKP